MCADIYHERGLSPLLAKQVAIELTEKDVIRAHARDELVPSTERLHCCFTEQRILQSAFTDIHVTNYG